MAMRVDPSVVRIIAAFLVLGAGLYRIVIDGLTPDGLALLTPALALLAMDPTPKDPTHGS